MLVLESGEALVVEYVLDVAWLQQVLVMGLVLE